MAIFWVIFGTAVEVSALSSDNLFVNLHYTDITAMNLIGSAGVILVPELYY